MPSIEVRDTDLVFLTIGSMVSNASFGTHDRPVGKPAVGSQNLGGAWTLWKKIATKQPDFGRPEQFLRDISQSKMMTFTVTFRGGLFQRKFEWLVERQMGRQCISGDITRSRALPLQVRWPARNNGDTLRVVDECENEVLADVAHRGAAEADAIRVRGDKVDDVVSVDGNGVGHG